MVGRHCVQGDQMSELSARIDNSGLIGLANSDNKSVCPNGEKLAEFWTILCLLSGIVQMSFLFSKFSDNSGLFMYLHQVLGHFWPF